MKNNKNGIENMPKVTVIRPLKARIAKVGPVAKNHSNRGACKKVRFRDHQEAIDALHTIARFKKFAGAEGRDISGRNERRTYNCDRCKGVHLTSQPTSWSLELSYAA